MSYLRFVCLLASTLTTAAVLMAVAQSPALQRGVSVQMAVTNNAAPMPDADDHDAWIVTVTNDGSLYLGVDRVSPPSNLYYDMKSRLYDETKSHPRNRDEKLFIKADARVSIAYLYRIFATATALDFGSPVLLTSQPEAPTPGTIVPPAGFEVVPTKGWNKQSILVELSNSGQPTRKLKVNSTEVSAEAFPSTLQQLLKNGSDQVVLTPDAGLPFADVAHVIDLCRATGAKVFWLMPRVQ